MNLAEIQSFRQIGRRLRDKREMWGLTLPAIANSCGLAISEVVRIENGEFLGFRQALKDTLTNAEVYAKALDIELGNLGDRQAGATIGTSKDEVFIPAFLRKK